MKSGKLIVSVIITFLILDNIYAEQYVFIQGPANQSMSGGVGKLGANNIIHWSGLDVDWYLNNNGAGDGLTFQQTYSAVDTAFDQWENVSTASITFDYQGGTSNEWIIDNKNVHFWAESGDSIYSCGLPSSWRAITVVTINSNEECTDVDIVFNGRDRVWKVNGDTLDIWEISAHEIGHMIGLHHTEEAGPPRPTMRSGVPDTVRRTLEKDDRIGVSFIYGGNLIDDDNGETLSNINYFRWNVNVTSGVTLTINSGATINLLGNYIKSTGGTIIREGGSTVNPDICLKTGSTINGFYPTIGAAIADASSGQDVWVGPGTYTESFSMKTGVDVRSTIAKPTIIGNVSFSSVINCTLEDFEVDGTIYLEYSSGVIDGVTSESSSDTAIYLEDSWVDIIDFTSSDGVDIGIYLCYASAIILDNAHIVGAGTAIRVHGMDFVEIYGSYFCYNDWDIYRTSSAGLWLIEDDYSNTFSGSLLEVFYGVDEIDWPDHYDMCGFKKAIGGNASGQLAAVGNLVRGISEPTGEKDLLARGMGLIRGINRRRIELIRADSNWSPQDFADQYAEAIKIFNQVVADSPDGELTRRAMSGILSSYWRLGQSEEVYKYLNTFRDDARYAELRPYVDRRLMSYYMHQGDPSKALQLADSLLASPLDEQQRAALLYQIGNIYWRYLNDPSQAAVYFWQLVKDYPDDPVTESVLAQLASMGESVPGGSPIEPEPVEALALEGYPNPFNPTATIRFGLPEAGKVTLVIYDLMGREVLRLVEGYREAGRQQIVWDGRDARGRAVPTGIYIARIVTPRGAKAIKLVMMK